MRIKKIELQNFRQFNNERLVFNDLGDKKVTIVHGKTHIGKTTLVKALLWCLYKGDSSFKNDPILVNKDDALLMQSGEKKKVSVAVDLENKGESFTVITEQTFVCNKLGDVIDFTPESKEPKRTILKLTKNGDIIGIPSENVDAEIANILPSILKDYFFYDGENNKIDEVAEKSSLQDAVKNIMNLYPREELIKYFSDDYTGRLVERFKEKKATTNEEVVSDLKERRSNCEKKLENERNNNEELKKNIERLDSQIRQLSEQIASNKEAGQLQERAHELQRNIDQSSQLCEDCFNSLIQRCDSGFNFGGIAKLFSAIAYKKANLTTSYANIQTNERSYKHLTCESVDEIIEKGVCVCGQKIEKGSDFYKHLIEEKEYISPKDYSSSLKSFTERFEDLLNSAELQSKDFQKDASNLKGALKSIDQNQAELDVINTKLGSFKGDVSVWQDDLSQLKIDRTKNEDKIAFSEETIIPNLNDQIKNYDNQIDKFTIQSDHNSHIDFYLKYITAVRELAKNRLDKRKADIAVALESNVNTLFHNIVGNDKTKLKLDESSYNVEPVQNGQDITLSTGQKTMKNLAFVGGLIFLSKNRGNIGLPDSSDFDEPNDYPLVMDAPFSNLSKDDIKRACKELPKYCSQLIITLLDKDYDLAIDELKPFIDKSYSLETNETSTDSHFKEDVL